MSIDIISVDTVMVMVLVIVFMLRAFIVIDISVCKGVLVVKVK